MKKYHIELDGGDTNIEAEDVSEALRLVSEWADEDDWGYLGPESADDLPPAEASYPWCTAEGYLVFVRATCVDDDEETDSVMHTVEPPEFECSEAEHDWCAPHDVVGGGEPNPGVYAEGGLAYRGTDLCSRCRTVREWHSDAQRPRCDGPTEWTRYRRMTESEVLAMG